MKMNAKLLISLTCVSLGLTACSDDYFDQEAYDAKLKQAFPVDNVDPTHTWATMGTAQINATVNGDYGETYRVAVYLENPLYNKTVTILASADIVSGEAKDLKFSYPIGKSLLYFTCYDKTNHYIVKTVEVSDGATVDVNFFGEDTSAARQQNTTRAVTNPNLTDTDYSAYVKAKETKKDYMDFINPTWLQNSQYYRIDNLEQVVRDANVMTEEAIGKNELSNDNRTLKWWRIKNDATVSSSFTLNGDQNTLNKAIIYVEGILNLQSSPSGVTFIVAKGGIMNINNNITLGQGSRIVVLSGGNVRIYSEKKLQLGNNGISVGLYNAGTVNVQGTLIGGNGSNPGALLYNVGTMTIKTLENMRYLFNYGTMTITDNFTIPNNADCPISTTNKYHFYNEGELTISTGTTGNAVNYGKLNGTTLNISDNYYYNGGTSEFKTIKVKQLTNFGKLTFEENQDDKGERWTVNACYLHIKKNQTSSTGFRKLIMLKNSLLQLDGDMYFQENNGSYMEDKSLLTVGGNFNIPNDGAVWDGPSGSGEYAIVKIAGNINMAKWCALTRKTNGAVYLDWAHIGDGVAHSSIKNKEGKSDADAVEAMLAKMASDQISETTVSPTIVIAGGDCTGDGYKGKEGEVVPPVEGPMSYRFCFEDNFPVPGDYDFNDCVITVTPVVKGKDVTLTVSLDGVGATKTIGAALRLVGINESDIDITSASCNADLNSGQQSGSVYARVTPVRELGNKVFAVMDKDKGYANGSMTKITDLVVRLFDNAHYAMSRGTSYDSKFYNTVSPSDPLAGESYVDNTYSSRTMTFTFKVSDEDKAQKFREQETYDVFIVENHNGKTYEVHTVNYKFDEVLGTYYGDGTKLKAYKENTVTVNYPWAVCVPHSSKAPFYYPREWWSISGTKIREGQDTENYGGTPAVYPEFKSWAADQSQSQEWYKNPVSEGVFKLN